MKKRVRNKYSEVTIANNDFPYFVLNNENISLSMEYKEEIIRIMEYYSVYNVGSDFSTEGSAGHYIPSVVHYKLNKILIDKQARFMFSQVPDINITGSETENDMIEIYKKVVNRVVEKNNFGLKLLRAAKDCFIGKRVACLVDMSERSGIILHFYTSLEFYYETDYMTGEIVKFISFENVTKSKQISGRRYVINRYHIDGEKVYVSSILCDGGGGVIETYVSEHATDLKQIPVVIITNDGLLGDKKGVSDLEDSELYESGYSKMANAEVDANRKGMNPVRYVVDMNSETTKNLPTGPGAFWDMEHDQNIDDPSPQVGQIAPAMNHTDAVKTSLDRLRSMMFETMDIPDISKDGLLSGITSFKALKALYYPLMVRCDEKLKVWKPAIAQVFRFVIELACLNESTTKELYSVSGIRQTEYDINIVENYALIDDETEEKASDMEEIAVKTRSRFSYLKKWRGEELKTDDDIREELFRIAEEENMMDTLSVNTQVQNRIDEKVDKEHIETMTENAESEIS